MNSRFFNFYIVSNDTKIHMFKGTLDDFEKVEQLYAELWLNVIDNQLDLIYSEDAYDVSKLTSDPVLLNWEGSDIEAYPLNNENAYYYLGDGKLETIGR